jgi:hypothetical protein
MIALALRADKAGHSDTEKRREIRSFEPAPEGVHTGILASLVDLGDQESKFGTKRQARLKWVLPEVKDDKGEGFLVFQTIWNLSLRSQVFRDVVSALLPGENLKGRSLRELVGKAARLTIEHNDAGNQVYANVASVKPLKAKAKAPVLDPGQLAYFSLDPDEFSEAAFNALSDRDREKVRVTDAYKTATFVAANKGKPAAAIIGDELPDW